MRARSGEPPRMCSEHVCGMTLQAARCARDVVSVEDHLSRLRHEPHGVSALRAWGPLACAT